MQGCIFEDEREIEGMLAAMATRPDIDLRRPVTADDWTNWVYKSGSVLAKKAAQAYVEATEEQADICERLFRSPLAVVTGAAGTGKTTVIEALVRGVRRAEGEGASIKVLAPTGSGDMLRSKSEVIIANMLHERGIPFRYELPLFAGDGTLRLPDFTVTWAGKTYFWEHLGRLDLTDYASEWAKKKAWYERWFPGQLLTTEEGPHLSSDSEGTIGQLGT